jgi:hypothetical protein
MVGEIGFEPTTLCSQSRCATRLRYSPTGWRLKQAAAGSLSRPVASGEKAGQRKRRPSQGKTARFSFQSTPRRAVTYFFSSAGAAGAAAASAGAAAVAAASAGAAASAPAAAASAPAAAASAPAAAASAPSSATASAAGASVVASSAAFSPQAARANMLAATAIAANFFMMCGLPKMPYRVGETFPFRERRDLAVPHESSTKIIEMVGARGILSFPRNNRGGLFSSSWTRIADVAA